MKPNMTILILLISVVAISSTHRKKEPEVKVLEHGESFIVKVGSIDVIITHTDEGAVCDMHDNTLEEDEENSFWDSHMTSCYAFFQEVANGE